MKVLLVNPPDRTVLIGNNPEILEEERGFNPPLGILYLATYLKNFSDHQVKVVDCQAERIGTKRLYERAKEFKPDIVGLTVMTFTLLDVIKAVKALKKASPGCKIVLGGPHAHLYPEETLALDNVDFVVMGEGERPFLELINALAHGKSEEFENIKGLVWKENNEVKMNPVAGLIQTLDEIPHPDRTMTPYEKYSSVIANRSIITTMITSPGCPYRCRFCDRPHLGKLFRAHSAEYVVQEIKDCVSLGIHEIIIYDDTFTIDRERVMEICRQIAEEKIEVAFDIRARVNTVDEEMLHALRRAGCERIHFGVEAGTEEMLKVLNKGITLAQAKTAFNAAKKAGISTLAYFMIGNPGETKEQILQTFAFMKELDPDFVHITILTPFPGTQIYFEALEKGIIKEDIWQRFAANPAEGFSPQYWEEHLTRDELKELIRQAYKGFYTRPSYILKRLFKIRSFSEFFRKAKAGLKVFRM